MIEGLMKKCNTCKRKHHDECSVYRGVLKDKRYVCFDCYAHANLLRSQKDEQDKKYFNREYLERESRDPYNYVP